MIYNPLEEYKAKFKLQHADNVNTYLDELVKKSGVDVEENR